MRLRSSLILGVALIAGACRGERARPGPPVRRVALDPDVVNFSRRGDQLILAGRVYRGNVLASDTGRFAWRAVDSAVAAVTQDGVVTARGDGVTRIWGVSGADSAFAVIVVQLPVAPPVVTVTPGQLRFSAVTAAADISAGSSDTLVLDSLPACRSDNPAVAVVESLTVRARGEGTTRVRCAIAGVVGSAQVTVRQRIDRVRLSSEQPFTLRVARDTLSLALARVDSLRQPVTRGVPRFVSLDTNILQVDGVRGVVVAVALGAGKIVGSVEGMADTAEIRAVDVIAAPTITTVATRRGGAAGSSARRPGVRTVGGAVARASATQAALGARDFQARDSIFQVGGLVASRPERWGTAVFGGAVERHVDAGLGLLSDTTVSTGAVFGLEGEATPARRLRFRLMGLFGSMNGPPGEAGSVAEIQADVGVAPLNSWLWLQVGGGRRALAPKLGKLGQWTSLRAGTEARFGFGKGQLEGLVRITFLPVVTATGASNNPSFGLTSDVGVSYRNRVINAGVQYGLERLDFPKVGTFRRREQFGVLRLRFGLAFGR